MTDHDPLCPQHKGSDGLGYCMCGLIAQARADERERIAQAIDYAWTSDYDSHAIRAYEDAARIARGGVGD